MPSGEPECCQCIPKIQRQRIHSLRCESRSQPRRMVAGHSAGQTYVDSCFRPEVLAIRGGEDLQYHWYSVLLAARPERCHHRQESPRCCTAPETGRDLYRKVTKDSLSTSS